MQLNELNLILNKADKTKNDFDLLIETGSYVGETIGNIKSEFKKLISIEITEKYSNYCKSRFINDKNVEIIKGDSLIELPKLLDEYNDKKIVFFLDGHYSAGDTGKNGMDVPLIEELKIIYNKCNNEALIIIDDADLFDIKFELLSWEGINEKNIFDELKNRAGNHFYTADVRTTAKKRLTIILKVNN